MQSKPELPVFVINLKQYSEKKEHMQQLCSRYSLQPRFIDAVYGPALGEEEINSIYDESQSIAEIGRSMTRGEIGCALSHRKIYQSIIDEGIPQALILEDDVDFDDRLCSLLERRDHFPEDWECMLLGHHAARSRDAWTASSIWRRKQVTKSVAVVRLAELACGTYGYMVTLKGAKKLYEASTCIDKPMDHYTGDDRYTNLYGTIPPCIKIADRFAAESMIATEREAMQTTSPKSQSERLKGMKRCLEVLGLLSVLQGGMRQYRIALQSLRRYYLRIKPLRSYG